MLLKRHYGEGGKVVAVTVLRGQKTWKPSTRIVQRGLRDGWLSIIDGRLILRAPRRADDTAYKILAPPGVYCCHCGEPVGNQVEARAHVRGQHKGVQSPSALHPAGYAHHHFYLCERVDG